MDDHSLEYTSDETLSTEFSHFRGMTKNELSRLRSAVCVKGSKQLQPVLVPRLGDYYQLKSCAPPSSPW